MERSRQVTCPPPLLRKHGSSVIFAEKSCMQGQHFTFKLLCIKKNSFCRITSFCYMPSFSSVYLILWLITINYYQLLVTPLLFLNIYILYILYLYFILYKILYINDNLSSPRLRLLPKLFAVLKPSKV